MSNLNRFDVVYYWVGGRAHGKWNEALIEVDLTTTISTLMIAGYIAVRGSRSIGAPDGAPSEDKWDRLEEIVGARMR